MPNGPAPLRVLRLADRGFVWDYPVLALEGALVAQGVPAARHEYGRALTAVTKAMARLGLVRNLVRRPGNSYLVTLMGLSERRLFPTSYLSESVPVCFDCWPFEYGRWERFYRRHRIRLAFLTARQSAERFARRIPGMETVWLPEATDPEQYDPTLPLVQRGIDVLELGRRDAAFHERITPALHDGGVAHRYAREQGEILWATRAQLTTGLATSKISVCFPGSRTNPARCGNVETLTHRYLESMASKTIVYGACPRELADLFGYDPVVPADANDPAGQLLEMVGDVAGYQPLVDRNYQRLLEVGTWQVRAGQLREHLAERGYLAAAH